MKKYKTILKAAVTALIMGVMFVAFGIIASAEVIEWDGKTPMEANSSYKITKTVKIKKPVTIPEGTKLSVKADGQLKLYKGGSLNVYGELSVAREGKVTNSGNISIKPDADLNLYGTLQSSVSGTLNISGTATIYNQGVLQTSSETKIYTTGYIFNKGELSFFKSADAAVSGKIVTNENSQLQLRSPMRITKSGKITVNGHLVVGSKSDVKCSGVLTLAETSSFTRFKIITVTKSGSFIDNRAEYEYQDMTVDILFDAPVVKRKGIDVSYAQGDIDWKKVADSGVEFAIIRAARGRAGKNNQMKEDDYFKQNIKGAQENGIDVGVYFYSYATSVSEIIEEAEFFVDVIDGYKIQYPVILDLEEEFQGKIGKKKLTKMIEAFFEVLMENKYYPMLYSYKNWIETYLDMTEIDKFALWLAQVSDKVTYDGGYYIWQYSFTGKVKGINGGVDLDISYRDFPTIFKKYGLNNL